MKLLSLFDGSGGFPLAASMCGITPVMAAEVEPYPIAVTKSRFPKMKHLGNVQNVRGGEIEPVDIITFGSPCQDLSVAGQRKGLKHIASGDDETTRSGLFLEAIRIIKEMREATNGIYPRYAVWENVPGAFSSNKGEDFRTVLDELIKISEPDAVMPDVPKAGWAYADCYSGDRWSLAYRVFDAQYWGVPQRRRRIYLVADFRDGRAKEILFVKPGLRGYFAQGRTPWQTAAGNAESGIGADDRNSKAGSIGWQDECAATLSAQASGTEPTVCIKEQHLFENHLQDVRYKGPLNVCPTLPARLGTGGNNTPLVVEEGTPDYCVQRNGIDRALTAGCNGKGWKEDTSYTLVFAQQAYDKFENFEKASTLKACGGSYGGGSENLVCETIKTRYIVRRLTPTECARLQGFPDEWGHPDKKEDFTDDEYRFWLEVRNTHAAINGKAVKEYTKEQMLTWYNKLHSDSAEYKMWGNGISLPVALYVLSCVAKHAQEDQENENNEI